MKNESNIIITRGQIGQWASFVGGTALLIGILGLIWQGGITPYITAALGIGAAGIAIWAVMTPDEFKGFITGRQVRYGTSAVFSTLLLIGIVAMTYIALQRAALTLDMTIDSRFTLSNETREVLKRLPRNIQIIGFYSSQELAFREVDDQFFRLYETETSGAIKRRYVDPEEAPAVAQRFAQQFGLIDYPNNVFLGFENPDGTLDFRTTTRVPRSESQERNMTQAILRLMATGTFTVYFENSHEEFDPIDNSQQGLSVLNYELQGNGYNTLPLDLKTLTETGGSIPRNAAAVILARPKTDLSPQEIGVIDAYLQRGGALFILADVLFNENPFLTQNGAFNQYLWEKFGLRALDAVVVDPASSGATALDVVSYQVFAENAIGANLNLENQPDTGTLFHIARALEVNSAPPVPNGRVILASPQSYGETNFQALRDTNTYGFDPDQDIPGPMTTVAWANNQTTGAKILLVGDGEFITNGQVSSPTGNLTLFMDGIGWLTGFSEEVRFEPQAFTTAPLLFVSAQMLDLIAFLTVILQPGAVLIIGLVVWLRRRRR